MAMISNRANDTPVQSQSERAAFFVCEPSQAMRAADREPTGGEIPVELVSRQPFDDFPPRCFGVSRTNRSIFEIRAVQQDGPMKTRGLFYLSPAFILFCCTAST